MSISQKRRVVVIEDEPLALNEIIYLLTTYHPDLEIVGAFENTADALQRITSGQVDGVFLDIAFDFIENGERKGLDFARRLSLLPNAPWIIFVTGDPKHALEAIEFRPFGYITKPIDELKLAETINKLPPLPTPPRPNPLRRKVRCRKVIQDDVGHIERPLFDRFLEPDDVLYIQANGSVHLCNGEVLKDVDIKLSDWLTFNWPGFIQIHRQTIVNLKFVSGYCKDARLLIFKDHSDSLDIGDTYFPGLKEALGFCGG